MRNLQVLRRTERSWNLQRVQRTSLFNANSILLQSCLAASSASHRKSSETKNNRSWKMVERTEGDLEQPMVSPTVALVPKRMWRQTRKISRKIKKYVPSEKIAARAMTYHLHSSFFVPFLYVISSCINNLKQIQHHLGPEEFTETAKLRMGSTGQTGLKTVCPNCSTWKLKRRSGRLEELKSKLREGLWKEYLCFLCVFDGT